MAEAGMGLCNARLHFSAGISKSIQQPFATGTSITEISPLTGVLDSCPIIRTSVKGGSIRGPHKSATVTQHLRADHWKQYGSMGSRKVKRGFIRSSSSSESGAASKYYVLQPDSKKATGYFPPFSKKLLDSLLVQMPPHLLPELRKQVQSRVKSKPPGSEEASNDEFLFQQVLQMLGEYNRNLLYQLPGESLEEVQSFLSGRGRVLYIAESKMEGAGRGAFAKVPIKAGTVITQYLNERQLLNAPGLDSRPPLGAQTFTSAADASSTPAKESAPEESVSKGGHEQKYDYYGGEDDWPVYAIPHLLNDHSCLQGPDLYLDAPLRMAQYLRRVATLNNVAFVQRWGERFAVATRDIEEGEELLWTYGISWWLDVERENLFMVLLWIASEQKELAMGANEQEMIREAWKKIRLLEQAAQAGKAMELEVVGRYGPKAREEVYVMEPLPEIFEDVQILKGELVPFYAEMLKAWKRDMFDDDLLAEMQGAIFA